MKVFFFESPNEINSVFGEPDYNIPFLDTTLLKFNALNYLNNEDVVGESIELYIPEQWGINAPLFNTYNNIVEELQEDKYELVVITSVFSLLASNFEREHIATLKQNPGVTYQNKGVMFGYTNDSIKNEPEETEMFDNFLVLSIKNFLRANSLLVGQLKDNGEKIKNNSRVFGNPIALSENIIDSTICGPCFISKDSFIQDSYIGPGTIITGKSRIIGSKVFSSFVDTSDLEGSELEDTITSGAKVSELKLSSSIIPLGSTIRNVGKI